MITTGKPKTLDEYITHYKEGLQKSPHSQTTVKSPDDIELYNILSLDDRAKKDPNIQKQLSYLFGQEQGSSALNSSGDVLFEAMNMISKRYLIIANVFDTFQKKFSKYNKIDELKKKIEEHPDLIKDSDSEIHGLGIEVPTECAFDKVRTLKIFDAIYEGLLTQKQAGKNHLTYVDMGTGTGILSYAIYHIAESLGLHVDIIAVEYNQETFDMANELLGDDPCFWNIQLLNIDGRELPKLLDGKKLDGYVSENLCAGNTTEMCNELFKAIKPSLAPDAITIPHGIRLESYPTYIKRDTIEAHKGDEASPYTFSQRNGTNVLDIKPMGKVHIYNQTNYTPTTEDSMDEIIMDYEYSAESTQVINSIVLQMHVFFGESGYSALEPNTATSLGNNMICALPQDITLNPGDKMQIKTKYLPGASEQQVYDSLTLYVNDTLVFAHGGFITDIFPLGQNRLH